MRRAARQGDADLSACARNAGIWQRCLIRQSIDNDEPRKARQNRGPPGIFEIKLRDGKRSYN
jgi:hypothetical protein